MLLLFRLGFGEFALDGFLFATGGLDFLEAGEVLFAVAADAVLLEADVFEIALVFQVNVGFEKMSRDSAGELFTADGIKTGFQNGDAPQTLACVDDGLDEKFFFIGSGFVVRDQDLAEVFVGGDIVIRQQNCLARECGFDGVVGALDFSGFGLRPG